jgi:hypothetical protein
MSRRSVPRGLVWSIAFFGVFVGHTLTYVLLAGNDAVRSAMLGATGHGYLSPAVHAGLALALVAAAGIFLGRLGRAGEPVGSVGRSLLPGVARFQIVAFTTIEVAERVAAHAPLRDLPHVLPVGTLVQVAVALIVTILIRALLRAADAVAETLPEPRLAPPPAILSIPSRDPAWVPTPGRSVARGRAPPR